MGWGGVGWGGVGWRGIDGWNPVVHKSLDASALSRASITATDLSI